MNKLGFWFICVFGILSSLSSTAQENLSVGVHAGPARVFANTSMNFELPGYNDAYNRTSRLLSFGGSLNYRFADQWEVSAGILYETIGYNFAMSYVDQEGYHFTSPIKHSLNYFSFPLRVSHQILTFDEEGQMGLRGILGGQLSLSGSKYFGIIGDRSSFASQDGEESNYYFTQGRLRFFDRNQMFLQAGTGVTRTFDNGDRFALDFIFSFGLFKTMEGKQYGFYDIDSDRIDYEYDYENHEYESLSHDPKQEFDFSSNTTNVMLRFSYYFSFNK